MSRVNSQKKKSIKSDGNPLQAPLERHQQAIKALSRIIGAKPIELQSPEHNQAKKFLSLITHKRVEIIPIYSNDQAQSYRRAKNEGGVKVIRDDKGITKFIQEEVNEKLGRKLSPLGKQISKFIETNDPQQAVDIIRKYPWVIFDDGTQILQSLLIALPQQEFLKILPYFRINFWNPIRDQVLRWQSRTQKGIPQKEREEAEKLLERAGLSCFIIKIPGRPKKVLPYSLISLIREYKIHCTELDEFLKRNYKEYIEERDGPEGPFLFLKVGDNWRLLNDMANRFIKKQMGADFYIWLDRKPKKITNTAHDLVKHILATKYQRDYYTIEKDLTDWKAKYIEETYIQS